MKKCSGWVNFFSLLPGCGHDFGRGKWVIVDYIEDIQREAFVFWVMTGMSRRYTIENGKGHWVKVEKIFNKDKWMKGRENN